MIDKVCPFCGAAMPEKQVYMIPSWECETSFDGKSYEQSYECLRRQRDQLIEKILILEAELDYYKNHAGSF